MLDLPAAGTVIGGRYRLDSVLGRGGNGAVFAGEHLSTGRAVAIKWLLPHAAMSQSSVQRFLTETQIMARIDHPNVITVIDAGCDGQSPWLVMERLRGVSLKERLATGRMPVAEVLEMILAACAGVAEAHAENVIHRDLKPDNIFLCQGKDGSPRPPKVLDFGISKLTAESLKSITRTGATLGTPHYMCREQLESARDADARYDVYSMGVVLYEALGGQRPFQAEAMLDLIREIAFATPVPLRTLSAEISPELEALVAKAMHRESEGRHGTMRQLIADLEAVKTRPVLPIPITAAVVAPVARTAPAPQRSRLPVILGCGAALVLGLSLSMAILFVVDVSVWRRPHVPAVQQPDPGSRDPGLVLGPLHDPLEPVMDLQMSGDCHARFVSPLNVATNQGQILAINSTQQRQLLGSLLFSQGDRRLEGTIPFDAATSTARRMTVQLAHDRTSGGWVNWQPLSSGSITFRQWFPEGGILDATFNDVTMQNWTTGTLCHVTGRVQTFGLRRGE